MCTGSWDEKRNAVVFREGSQENATISSPAALPTTASKFPESLTPMALEPTGKVPKDLQALFRYGRIGDLSDGVLLERFLTARDEAAFESNASSARAPCSARRRGTT